MQEDDALFGSGISAAGAVSTHLHTRLLAFLSPLLFRLDAQVDLRLVRTLLSVVEAILVFRNRSHGLLLSELGGYLDTPEHAPAGTKRLSNLLRSKKWTSGLIADYLFEVANNRKAQLEASGEDVLLVWDESVEAQHFNQLGRSLSRWARYDLICIDEVGYVPLTELGAELLFQVIADRAERAAVIITTNLPFSEWTQVFTNARLCKALLDRLTDRAHIIETGTESFRFRRTLEGRRRKD